MGWARQGDRNLGIRDRAMGYLVNPLPKIFLIGFNRCGTKSFHHFFEANGISSVHCAGGERKDNIACTLSKRLWTSNPLGRFSAYRAVSDMIYVGDNCHIEANAFFRELDHRYPDSYFIFNDRNLDDWIRSRYKFKNGYFAQRQSTYLGIATEELGAYWTRAYHAHRAAVEAYFAGRGNLLHFDIAEDDPARIVKFLEPHYATAAAHWSHVGKTAPAKVGP